MNHVNLTKILLHILRAIFERIQKILQLMTQVFIIVVEFSFDFDAVTAAYDWFFVTKLNSFLHQLPDDFMFLWHSAWGDIFHWFFVDLLGLINIPKSAESLFDLVISRWHTHTIISVGEFAYIFTISFKFYFVFSYKIKTKSNWTVWTDKKK